MKRVWIAVALLLVTIAVCITARIYQVQTVNRLIVQLDDTVSAYKQGDWDSCARKARQFSDDCQTDTRIFSYFLGHSDLLGCRESAWLVFTTAESRDEADFVIESARCRSQLVLLLDIDAPRFPNIF